MKKYITLILLFIIMLTSCNVLFKTNNYQAILVGSNFYNLDINKIIKTDFTRLSIKMMSVIKANDQGSLWIDGTINSSSYNFISNSYQVDQSYTKYAPEEINFFETFSEQQKNEIINYLNNFKSIQIDMQTIESISQSLNSLKVNEQVNIEFRPTLDNANFKKSGIAILKINNAGEIMYSCCLYFNKI
jgi:hypothetical protein